MTNGEIRSGLFRLDQAMTTQEQAITTQVQDLTTPANQEAVSCVNKNASTMSSCLRDLTRINPAMFFGYKVGEDP